MGGTKSIEVIKEKCSTIYDKPINVKLGLIEDEEQLDVVADKQRGKKTLNQLNCFTAKGESMRASKAKGMINGIYEDHPEINNMKSMKLFKLGLKDIEPEDDDKFLVEEVECENGEVVWVIGWYSAVGSNKVDWCCALLTGNGSMADLLANLIVKKMIGISSENSSKMAIDKSTF